MKSNISLSKHGVTNLINTLLSGGNQYTLDDLQSHLSSDVYNMFDTYLNENSKGSLNMFHLVDGTNCDDVIYTTLSKCKFDSGKPILSDDDGYFDQFDRNYVGDMYEYLLNYTVDHLEVDHNDDIIIVLDYDTRSLQRDLMTDFDNISDDYDSDDSDD